MYLVLISIKHFPLPHSEICSDVNMTQQTERQILSSWTKAVGHIKPYYFNNRVFMSNGYFIRIHVLQPMELIIYPRIRISFNDENIRKEATFMWWWIQSANQRCTPVWVSVENHKRDTRPGKSSVCAYLDQVKKRLVSHTKYQLTGILHYES